MNKNVKVHVERTCRLYHGFCSFSLYFEGMAIRSSNDLEDTFLSTFILHNPVEGIETPLRIPPVLRQMVGPFKFGTEMSGT